MSQPSQAQLDVGKLKEALWFSLGKVIEEESQRHGKQTTAQFTGAMTEIVWTQLGRFLLRGALHLWTG